VSTEIEKLILKFFITFHNTFKCNYRKLADILLLAYKHDLHRLSSLEFLPAKYLVQLINMLRAQNADTLNAMRDFVKQHRSEYREAYIVDCLGFPELYAIWCEACEKGFLVEVKVFINRDATTRALKEVFNAETLDAVAQLIDGMVLRRLDTLLHSELFSIPREDAEFKNLLVERMKYAAMTLLSLVRDRAIILSDHGYDVLNIDSKYVAMHMHMPRSKIALAKLAPLVLLKKPRR